MVAGRVRGGYATIVLPSTLATLPALRGGDHHDRIDRTRGVRAAGIAGGRHHRTRAGDAERLRIHGSNPIDDAPMPALVEDWLL